MGSSPSRLRANSARPLRREARRRRSRGSEGEAAAQMNFAAGGHGHGDGAELRLVDVAVGGADVGFVEGVESLEAELEGSFFLDLQGTRESDVHRLQAGPVDGIATDIPKGISGGSSEGRGVEPLLSVVRAGAEDGRAGGVSANGIFAKDSAGISGVTEDGNSERHSGLDPIDGGEIPILC